MQNDLTVRESVKRVGVPQKALHGREKGGKMHFRKAPEMEASAVGLIPASGLVVIDALSPNWHQAQFTERNPSPVAKG